MVGHAAGPVSTRRRDETTAPAPRTAAGVIPFVLLPVAVVLAASYPVTTAAVVGGVALAKLHRRARRGWKRGENAPLGHSRWTTHDA
ncbi:hypothetical protein SAMN04488067_11226 [Halorubrum xinjiangense]|uniref:Uncharacterized protein n=1 Tax=Halorubrum xinjiangense TaxID=261291 RepID=A0A1G7QJ22_9EURY|nr:hypothetical protein [Halorubrum xinjiangense]SDF98531.1 hypothetical protein SAMN04488067_11226 [Halorubrum xinjiangense]